MKQSPLQKLIVAQLVEKFRYVELASWPYLEPVQPLPLCVKHFL
jgi:hypothetical protein